jgi:Zn-dependent membrane protease YugP
MLLFAIGIVFMLISLIVGWSLKSKFNEYAQIPLRSGLSGKDIAEKMLRDNGIYDVQVTCVQGQLTDHYNPVNKTVNLSPDVYGGRSIAAAAVAAHEVGHAVQHATAYQWLNFRSVLVPITNVSAQIMNIVFIGSFLLGGFFHLISWDAVLMIIVVAQGFITLFSLVTLPVEFDATRRGLAWLNSTNLTVGEEHEKATHALRLAATTYVVQALYALTTLLYFLLRLLGNRD